jgi:hypothetical protein
VSGRALPPSAAAPARPRLVLLLLVVMAALTCPAAAACGGDAAAFEGEWQRLAGGEPDPSRTLTIRADGDRPTVAFADLSTGERAMAAGEVSGGTLTCLVGSAPVFADAAAASPLPTTEGGLARLELTLTGAGEQLEIDVVHEDGSLDLLWVYVRPQAHTP